MIMVIYEAIYRFIMTYIFLVNPITGADINWSDFNSFFNQFFEWGETSTGRPIFLGFNFGLNDIGFFDIIGHFLTIVACISLCVMLWKLFTLPIKWAIKRVE